LNILTNDQQKAYDLVLSGVDTFITDHRDKLLKKPTLILPAEFPDNLT